MNVLGRNIFLYDCDAFTREPGEKTGVPDGSGSGLLRVFHRFYLERLKQILRQWRTWVWKFLCHGQLTKHIKFAVDRTVTPNTNFFSDDDVFEHLFVEMGFDLSVLVILCSFFFLNIFFHFQNVENFSLDL